MESRESPQSRFIDEPSLLTVCTASLILLGQYHGSWSMLLPSGQSAVHALQYRFDGHTFALLPCVQSISSVGSSLFLNVAPLAIHMKCHVCPQLTTCMHTVISFHSNSCHKHYIISCHSLTTSLTTLYHMKVHGQKRPVSNIRFLL